MYVPAADQCNVLSANIGGAVCNSHTTVVTTKDTSCVECNVCCFQVAQAQVARSLSR